MPPDATADKIAFEVEAVRADFPILTQQVHGKDLIYLDSAASAQKPRAVLDAMTEAHECYYSNVHRGIHSLSQTATDHFEAAREKVARFINAPTSESCIFTRGATESINLVANTWGRKFLRPGDEVLISALEHHANIVPWHFLKEQIGLTLKVIPIDENGQISLESFSDLLSEKTKLVAITHLSNALGIALPVQDMITAAHHVGARVLIDGCQAAPHRIIDVQALDVDFYAFSSHKLYGPTGIGLLYGKADLLRQMPPWQGGGEMIDLVTFERSTYKDIPHRFEAGTPAIVEAIGFGAAVDYLEHLGRSKIAQHEDALRTYAEQSIQGLPGFRVIGQGQGKGPIVSFVMDNGHPHDVGTLLDRYGVAVRVGHHCAQPLMQCLGVSATVRASFGLYNTRNEIDAFIRALDKVRGFLDS